MSRHRVPRVGTVGRTLFLSRTGDSVATMVGWGVTSTSVGVEVAVGSGSGVGEVVAGSGAGEDSGVDGVSLGAVVGSADDDDEEEEDDEGDEVADGDGVVAAGPELVSVLGRGRSPGRSVRDSASFAGPRAGTGRTAPT